MKKIFLFILISICSLYGVNKYKQMYTHISFPQCIYKKNIIDTEITFIIDEQLLNKYDRSIIQKKIEKFIKIANKILQNSCIPIQRRLGKVEYQTLEKGPPETSADFVDLYDTVIKKMPLAKRMEFVSKPSKIIVTLFEKLHDNYTGYTYPNINNRIMALSITADGYVMEHELGHLALADHELSGDNQNNYIKIAHGYKCGHYRSVMNENIKNGEVALFYSSPYIMVGNDKCGNLETANNTEQMLRWSNLTKTKLKMLKQLREKK